MHTNPAKRTSIYLPTSRLSWLLWANSHSHIHIHSWPKGGDPRNRGPSRMYLPMRRLRSWRCMFYASSCIFNEVFIFTTHSQRMRMGIQPQIQALGWPDTDTFPSPARRICEILAASVRRQLQLAEGVETKLPPIFMSKCFWPTWFQEYYNSYGAVISRWTEAALKRKTLNLSGKG